MLSSEDLKKLEELYGTVTIIDVHFVLPKFEFTKYHLLDIKMDMKSIESTFEKHKVIQLRPYNGEKYLVIGCGNTPISYGEIDLDALDMPAHFIDYRKDHQHTGCYTINPDIRWNPSMVVAYGHVDLTPLFKEGQFEAIYAECCGPVFNTPLGFKNLVYLLKDGGYVLDCVMVNFYNAKESKYERRFELIPIFKKNGSKLERFNSFDVNDETAWKRFSFGPFHEDHLKDRNKFEDLVDETSREQKKCEGSDQLLHMSFNTIFTIMK